MGRGRAADRSYTLTGVIRRLARPLTLAVVLAGAGGCSVGVPDPAAPSVAKTTPAPATPTITPGHDAAAVAAKDLPFTAGDSLAPGVSVALSDGLREAPGWKPVRENVAGENRYVKADGCVVSARVRVNQGALAVTGDDKASTVELRKRAREMGMRTLREDGVRKVLAGMTTAEEVIGVTMADAD